MDRLLYVAMSGAKQNMLAQNIHANNLANIETNGFKADFAQARSMPVFGEHHPSRVYAMAERPGVNFAEGSQMTTGRELDVSISGEGWFAVYDAEGNEAFTRSGNLKVNDTGVVSTQSDHVLVGGGGPLILPEFEKIEIAVDGVVSIRALGQGPEGLTEIDRLKLVNPDIRELEKGPDGLFRRRDGGFEAPSADVSVKTGVLENSNVNAVHALMEIISLQKQFEMQVKMMDKADTMDQSSGKILQTN